VQKLRNVCAQLPDAKILADLPSVNKMKAINNETDKFVVYLEQNCRLILFDDATPRPPDEVDASRSSTSGDAIALIQYSSGSTGTPKGVTLTHNNLLFDIKGIINRGNLSLNDSMLSWMPLTHDMGLICFHLTGIVLGCNQFLMAPETFVKNPVMWLRKASEHKIHQLYSPNFGYRYFIDSFNAEESLDLDLSCVRLIYNGAELISYDLCRTFLNVLKPFGLKPSVMFPGYGLAEASVAVTLPNPQDELKVHVINRERLNVGDRVEYVTPNDYRAAQFVEVGFAIENCELRIADQRSNSSMAEGYVGIIFIKGKNVTSAYYNLPSETAEVIDADGWLLTGDVGFLKESRLIVLGRQKNIIIINGQNYYPQDVESVIEKVPGVAVGKVAATSTRNESDETESLVIFVQSKNRDGEKLELLKKAIRAAVVSQIGLLVDHIIYIHRIPKTTSGKVQYFKLRELAVRETTFKNNDRIEVERKFLVDRLKEILSDLGIRVEDSPLPILSFLTSSLQLIRFKNVLESVSGKRLSLQMLFSNPSLQEIADFLNSENTATIEQSAEKTSSSFEFLKTAPQRFWGLEHLTESAACNLAFKLDLPKSLDLKAYRASWLQLVQRHEALRSNYFVADGEFQMSIRSTADNFLFTEVKSEEVEDGEYVSDFINRKFNLKEDSLIRSLFTPNQTGGFTHVVVVHHIIFDGYSVSLLFNDLQKLYNRNQGRDEELPLITTSYRSVFAAAKSVRKHLTVGNESCIIPLLGTASTTKYPNENLEVMSVDFTAEFLFSLRQFCSKNGITPFTLLLTCVHIIIYKYTGHQTIKTGVSSVGRFSSDFQNMIGCFARSIVLQLTIQPEKSFINSIRDCQEELAKELDSTHRLPPLADVGDEVPYNILVTHIAYENNANFQLEDRTVVAPQQLFSNGCVIDYCFEFEEHHDALRLNFKYNRELASQKLVRQLLDHFEFVTNSVAAQPTVSVSKIHLMTADERARILKFSDVIVKEVRGSVVDLFRKAVQIFPENECAICNGTRLTYKEVDQLSDRIARRLAMAAAPQSGVGVCVSRSELVVPIILGILKARCIYVPIDVENPTKRKLEIIERCELSVLIGAEFDDELTHKKIVRFSIEDILTTVKNESMLTDRVAQDDIAYILFTSGSTGIPKGVIVSHRAIADYVQNFVDYFGVTQLDKILQQASLAFDTSLEEIFSAICTGATLVIAETGGKDVRKILDLIAEHHVTILSTTPLVLGAINKTFHDIERVRLVVSGGDKLKADQIDRLIRRVDIYDTYGPTEGTVCTTFGKIVNLRSVGNIGKPIHNRYIRILDKDFNMVPVGIRGEIYIGGAGLAEGYVQDDSSSFVADPYRPSNKLYRTGDFGKWNADGSIQFVGKLENQTKVNGYRIDLHEVESILDKFPFIRNSWATTYENGVGADALAVVVESDQGREYAGTLKVLLRERLPLYMIPTKIIVLPAFPRTQSHKVDVVSLMSCIISEPANTPIDGELKYIGVGLTLKEIWATVLHDEVSIGDDFFDKGGNSISVTEAIASMKDRLGIQISYKDFYAYSNFYDQMKFANGLVQPANLEIND